MVAVVDDDPSMTAFFERALTPAGFLVQIFGDAESLLNTADQRVADVVCLDLQLPGMDGLTALQHLRRKRHQSTVIMLSGNSSVDLVVAAIRHGAYDYISKPTTATRLRTTVENAAEHVRLTRDVGILNSMLDVGGYQGLLGRSTLMRNVFEQIERVAESDISVLILGESGTGKELVARAIHDRSRRKNGRFVALNCAAVPEPLQEDELFGHEHGAFSGATRRRIGRVEYAHKGTLFLDEVSELSPLLQAKLLRVLQERSFQRIGSNDEIESDFRVLAATHRDLASEVAAGRFREDLFFRLAVFDLHVPPLRMRGDDVALLATAFVHRYAVVSGSPGPSFSPEALAALAAYSWPGNVRELQNTVQRAAILAQGRPIQLADLTPRLIAGQAAVSPAGLKPPSRPLFRDGPDTDLATMQRQAIQAAIVRHRGNVAAAVRQLGISRTTLYRKMKEYNLRLERPT